ncbi:MAG TPA: hypothetical protein ENK44_08130 [Caldithrix abyssi]|uniref:Threonyl-tRNA synthetase editing domain-containing protein n=1 Tax=Caldithrix abyssi TaxID=187145 RepID=A0A7V4WVL8_CALAY|nr:hypothetical protein [Caldithrix abyssi]
MRVLFWYMDRFAYKPAVKNLDDVETVNEAGQAENAVVAFVHGEEKDEENPGKAETKLIKNIKWLAGKWDTKKVVLHSFAHLGESKCDPACLKALFDRAEERLAAVGYDVAQTPYGYFLDIEIAAPGRSLARVYKEF